MNNDNRDKRGKFIKGHTFNLGKKGNYGKFERTTEYRKKIGEKSKGHKLDEEAREKIRKSRLGKRNSPKTEFKKGDTTGEKSYLWKGGISPLNEWIRHFVGEYWRVEVFKRDYYTCQKCGIKSGCGKTIIFHVHHIKPFSTILSEFLNQYSQFSPINDKETLVRLAGSYKPFFDINNGITLCSDCHLGGKHYVNK